MRVALWTTLGVAVAFEAYTRVYLLKHWISDVMPGGLLFGAALLFAWATAAWLLDRGAWHHAAVARACSRRRRPW